MKVKIKDGNAILKVKLSKNESIDDREFDYCDQKTFVSGLLKGKKKKKHVLEYISTYPLTLEARLEKPIGKVEFYYIVERVIEFDRNLLKNGLASNKVIYDPKYVFYNESKKELWFPYLPLEKPRGSADIHAFIMSIIHATRYTDDVDAGFMSRFVGFMNTPESKRNANIEVYIKQEDRYVINDIMGTGYLPTPDSSSDYNSRQSSDGRSGNPYPDSTALMGGRNYGQRSGGAYSGGGSAGSRNSANGEGRGGSSNNYRNGMGGGNVGGSSNRYSENVSGGYRSDKADVLTSAPTGNPNETGDPFDQTGYLNLSSVPDSPGNSAGYSGNGNSATGYSGAGYAGAGQGYPGTNYTGAGNGGPGYSGNGMDQPNDETGYLSTEDTGYLIEHGGVDPYAPQREIRYPKLVRVLTNEIIEINKPVFRMGKERSYADYFVDNNPAVSRNHCDIIVRGTRCSVMDLNSKNRTFVNGRVIPIRQEVELRNGDTLTLANEEFKFQGI